jgi:histidinol-phosphate aminotransferase
MNMPSILCGVEAVKDRAYFDKTRNAIMETRAETAKKLEALGQLGDGNATKIVIPSDLQGLVGLVNTIKEAK